MSVEPPPPDWVISDAALNPRRSILDGEEARRTQSIPPVVLEYDLRRPPSHGTGTTPGENGGRHPRAGLTPAEGSGHGAVEAARQWWADVAFTMWRRGQLIALAGFVAVIALTVYGWQRGTLSGMAAGIAGESTGADGAPAAPRLSSDDVPWTELDPAAGEGDRRSTAGFASDHSAAGQSEDDPTSGAKLFVASGKKSSKRSASKIGGEETAEASDGLPTDGPEADGGTATGDDKESSDPASTAGSGTEKTATAVVRFENCAQAAAAGAAPIRLGEPGYRLSLDRDKDGVACENGSQPEDPGDAPVDSLYAGPTTTDAQESATTTASTTPVGTTSSRAVTTTSSLSTTLSSTALSSTTRSSTTGASTSGSTTTGASTTPTTSSTGSTTSTTSVTTTTTSTQPPTTVSSTSGPTTESTTTTSASTTTTTPSSSSTATTQTSSNTTTTDPLPPGPG